MLSAFLRAYKLHTGTAIVDETFICKVAIAVGAFILLLMPATVWDCEEEESDFWKKTALDYVKAGAETNLAWLRQSCLGPLFT